MENVNVELHLEPSRAGAIPRLRLEHEPRGSLWDTGQPLMQFSIVLLLTVSPGASKCACVLKKESKLPTALLLVRLALQPAYGEFIFLCRTLAGMPSIWLNYSLPGRISASCNFSFPLSPLPGTGPDSLFFLLDCCGYFL